MLAWLHQATASEKEHLEALLKQVALQGLLRSRCLAGSDLVYFVNELVPVNRHGLRLMDKSFAHLTNNVSLILIITDSVRQARRTHYIQLIKYQHVLLHYSLLFLLVISLNRQITNVKHNLARLK